MSIKYNNKVIAGKYKEQVIPFANTIDAGIAKIATQEQINEGTDNTSIVTPVYLAQKQDKLTAGEGIHIDATNTISSKVLPDKVTIIENDNKTITTVARKTINEKLVFDWEGTEAEYHQAIMNGEIDPDWYCYITDDELSVSYNDVLSRTLVNIAPDGIKVLGASNAYLTNDVYIDEAGYNQLLELKNSAIKIDGVDNLTINGQEVAIPYVLTHTGSKIVDVKYRDTLVEFYNENGYTNYFTIDEENKNYTLPMGEIYGKLVDKDLSDISDVAKDTIKDIAGVSFNLFDTKLSDHVLSLEESVGWALQGTYVYKEAITGERFGYPTFYEKCIEEKNAGTAKSVTLGSSTITMYVNDNGHQFYNIADKAKVDTYYTSFGIADFYGIDEENECIFLPRNKWFMQLTDDTANVNKFTDAGLPNITGTSSPMRTADAGWSRSTGAFKNSSSKKNTEALEGGVYSSSSKVTSATVEDFNASRSSAVYGKSTTVQPKSSSKLLYYCVGNTKADTSWINIFAQVEEGIKEIYDQKAEVLEEINALRETSVDEIGALKQDSINEIDTLRATSVNEISTLNTGSLDQIEALTNENISKIENVKNTSLNELNVLKHQSVDELETLRQESVDEIDDLRQEGVNEISTLKKESIDEIEDKRISSNESITNTKNESISEFVGIASDKIDEAKYWAVGTEKENPQGSAKYWAGVAELSSSNALFDTKVSDHILKDSEAYGWALQGTYVYEKAILGEHLGYPTFYYKCIEEYTNPTNEKLYLSSNINAVGSLTNNNGILSGFTTANYAKIPNKVNLGNNFEIVFKITTGEDITTSQRIFDGLTEQYLVCFIASNTNCFNYAFGDGTQWLQTSEEMLGKNQINPNTSYKIKITFDGTVYISYISTEDGLWIEDWRWESANIIPEYNFIIGISRDFNTPCLCSIDLNECYININGELWWTGVNYITKNLNGHKYYNIKNKNIIDNLYNQYGIADFYGIDETNERVLLPRNKYFHQLTGDTSKVNEMVEAGLPNITGNVSSVAYKVQNTGALTIDNLGVTNQSGSTTPLKGETTIKLDASRSSAIYGNSDTVQPQASLKLLYYCVGNTKADTSWMKLTEQVEAGIKDIEDKRVNSISDVETLRVNSINEIVDTKNNGLQEIDATKITNLNQIEDLTLEGIHTLTGASNALNRNQITNCLIEVPQRIKYTLVDGALTVLAGSQAIVPWGTKYPFETFGSLTINEENIASGFSSTNYIVFKEPFNPKSNTWEQMWKITTGEDIVSVNNVLNRVPENLSSGFCFVIRDSKIGIYISSGTESYDIANSLWSEQTLEPNTTYYIKNSFDGSKYSMDISTDKINFTNYITVESTLTISPIKNKIGAYGTEEHHFKGLIHLNECYIKIGDEIWWEGKQRNLEEECPIGSIFLNNNFKVADTQFVNGKFFVWVELQNDTVVNCGNAGARMVFLGYDGIVIDSNIDGVYSVEPEGVVSRRWYDNNNNLMKQHDGTNWTTGVYLSLGFMLCTSDSNKTFVSVDQTFNGLGYIGSTIWVDKGVKGLYPNYRNLDGTLRNIEYTTKNLKFLELTKNYTDQHIRLNETQLQIGTLFYDDIENANKLPSILEYRGLGIVGSVSVSSGKITKFDIKLPFRAIGYSDLAEAHVVIQTYKNGTSWYRIWSDGWCEQGGRGNTANSNVTVNLLKAFKDTTYTVSIGNNTNGAYASPSSCDIVSNSQIRLRCAGTAEWMWQACGYIK